MTPSEIADKLASDAAREIDELIQERHAEKIAETCCLKELLEVAEWAILLEREMTQIVEKCDLYNHPDDYAGIYMTRQKLAVFFDKIKARGIEPDSSPKKEGR